MDNLRMHQKRLGHRLAPYLREAYAKQRYRVWADTSSDEGIPGGIRERESTAAAEEMTASAAAEAAMYDYVDSS